jgi:hypothetical protein
MPNTFLPGCIAPYHRFRNFRDFCVDRRNFCRRVLATVALVMLIGAHSNAASIIAADDLILAIDLDVAAPASGYPGNETPMLALDEDAGTNYLNFGGSGSGFIVTPISGPSLVRSFLITTANDFPGRDPSTYALYGTNDPILSTDNSDGSVESWALISSGPLALPIDRFVDAPLVTFANSTSYASYRLLFPTLKSEPLMQVADVRIYATPTERAQTLPRRTRRFWPSTRPRRAAAIRTSSRRGWRSTATLLRNT